MYDSRAEATRRVRRPMGRRSVACEDIGPMATSPVVRPGMVSMVFMRSRPPRRLDEDSSEAVGA